MADLDGLVLALPDGEPGLKGRRGALVLLGRLWLQSHITLEYCMMTHIQRDTYRHDLTVIWHCG